MPRKSYRQHEKHQIYFYLNESGVFTLYKKFLKPHPWVVYLIYERWVKDEKEEYSLVYKAIHGDSHAYGELIHQYNPYFYKIAFYM